MPLIRLYTYIELYYAKSKESTPKHININIVIMLNSLLKDSPQKLKLEKINGALIILFYVSPRFPQQQNILQASLVEIHQYVP